MELLNHTIVLYELGNSVISDEAPAELKKNGSIPSIKSAKAFW